MTWLLHLYPARWRQRYGEEFRAVLANQRNTPGLFFDVLAGAVDAHLHPQIQPSDSTHIQEGDTMTVAMLRRCAFGGPKLSPADRRVAWRVTIGSALVIAALEIGLAKIYRGATPVQALIYWSAPALSLIYEQTAYLRKRPARTQALILGGGLVGMYVFMLAVCAVAAKL
ncbi:MAG: hypothetical protein ABSF59_01520 [Candidatus Sulfotelmatobacter sp.]|jgi:hypothetical protein